MLEFKYSKPFITLAIFGALTLASCGEEAQETQSEAPVTETSTSGTETAAEASNVITINPGEGAAEALQEALILVEPGSTVTLGEGVFNITEGLSLDVEGVTLIGQGMDKTILSFKDQVSGGQGLLVTSDKVVLKDFAVEDTKGDGIKAKGVDQISFLGLRVEWTGGLLETNGAYGLYPVSSKNVLVEGCVAKASSDAGIYVGQSQNIIVRNNDVQYNVTGIEIENSYDADVFGNNVQHNSSGLLVFDMPNLPQMGGRDIRVYNNVVSNNDTDNFSAPGTIVHVAPRGGGILIFSTQNVHVFNNEVGNNATGNLMMLGYPLPYEDPNMNPLINNIFVYNNKFGKAGWDPNGPLAGPLAEGLKPVTGGQFPSIIWDGASQYQSGEETIVMETVVVFKDNIGETGFLNLGLTNAGLNFAEANPSMELPGAGIEIPSYERVVLPQDM